MTQLNDPYDTTESTSSEPLAPTASSYAVDGPETTPADAMPPSSPASGGSDSSGGDTKEAAKQQAQNVKATATDAVSGVADTAKDQAAQVTTDVREQVKSLAGETKTQLSEQTLAQRDRAVDGLRSFGDELQKMAEQDTGGSGMARQLAREGSEWTTKAADFLEQRQPADLIDEVRNVARRRPGAFLVGAAVAGVVAGRLTRGAMAAKSDDSSSPASPPPASVGTTSSYPGVTGESAGTEYVGDLGHDATATNPDHLTGWPAPQRTSSTQGLS